MVCVVGRMRDLILQLSKSSIYSTKPSFCKKFILVSAINRT
ncbi:ankyrin repeat domain-containing protein, partial [Escherichia coli]